MEQADKAETSPNQGFIQTGTREKSINESELGGSSDRIEGKKRKRVRTKAQLRQARAKKS